MDKQLLDKIRKIRKPFTKELAEGWHNTDMETVDVYTEKAFRSIFKSLEEKGFFFDGIESVCPVEFFNTITNIHGSGTKDFEISKNSFFGVKLKSHFIDPKTGQREELKHPLFFLPFTNQHGDTYVRNSLYSLQLVLSERGPSVDGTKHKTIFIRVLGHKFKVTMELHKFYRLISHHRNVTRYPINSKLPANRFYSSRNDRKIKNKNTPIPLLSWYVFAKYGFNRAMTEFAHCEYVIDYEENLLSQCKESEGWEIYTNGFNVHPKCMSDKDEVDREHGIAIRSKYSIEPNSLAFQYAASMLFTMGVFSGTYDLREIDNPSYWRLLIGYCSIKLSPNAPPEAYLRQMDEHMVSVEEYADEFTMDRYRKSNIPVKDSYELFNYLIVNYSNIIRTYNPADLLHKELACKEFLLENLVHTANDFKFKIRNKSNITSREINRELDYHFKLFGIDKSIRENNTILEQTGTDNPFIDYGLGIIRQTKSTVNRGTGSKKDEFDPNHPGSLINGSHPFVVSYQYATGPHPDATKMLTPRVCLKNGRYTALHEEDIEIYKATVRRLEGSEE